MGSGSRRAPALLGVALAVLAGVAAAPARAEDDARGRELFTLCKQCHGDAAGGNPLSLAPAIAGLPEWYALKQLKNFHSGIRGLHFDDHAGMRMRPMTLWLGSDENIAAAADYVSSLPPVDPPRTLKGDPAKGAALYTAICGACHGPDGKGNEAMMSPPLIHQSDWYLVKQIKNYKAGIRGAATADQAGALMRPMSMTLTNDQAIEDVVAYIMTLPNQTAQK